MSFSGINPTLCGSNESCTLIYSPGGPAIVLVSKVTNTGENFNLFSRFLKNLRVLFYLKTYRWMGPRLIWVVGEIYLVFYFKWYFREMKSVLSLFGVIALFGIGLVHPVQGSEDSFPCTKLAEILPDAALTFAQEYFAWKNPDKINVSTK